MLSVLKARDAVSSGMAFLRFNIQTELKKLARGERTRVSHQELALLALDYVEASKPPDVTFLERLFLLADPR